MKRLRNAKTSTSIPTPINPIDALVRNKLTNKNTRLINKRAIPIKFVVTSELGCLDAGGEMRRTI
jgi:hypothetical protein